MLKQNGPDQGYYADSTKIILIMHQNNIKFDNVLVSVMGLRCAWALVILAVILGMKNPKAIGSKTG